MWMICETGTYFVHGFYPKFGRIHGIVSSGDTVFLTEVKTEEELDKIYKDMVSYLTSQMPVWNYKDVCYVRR